MYLLHSIFSPVINISPLKFPNEMKWCMNVLLIQFYCNIHNNMVSIATVWDTYASLGVITIDY